MNRMRVAAQHLMPGDVLITGDTVVRVSAGLRTPSGKVEVTLRVAGTAIAPVLRQALWNARTLIAVSKPTGDNQ
jgi:hypothetical protein